MIALLLLMIVTLLLMIVLLSLFNNKVQKGFLFLKSAYILILYWRFTYYRAPGKGVLLVSGNGVLQKG